MEDAALIPPLVVEADDEGEQVQRQRNHPQERDRRNVVGHLVGGRIQQQRSAGRQCNPKDVGWTADARRSRRALRLLVSLPAMLSLAAFRGSAATRLMLDAIAVFERWSDLRRSRRCSRR